GTSEPAGSPLGETSTVPAASAVATRHRGEASSHCRSRSCRAVRTLPAAAPRGGGMISRSSSTVVTGVPPNLLRWVMPLTLDREQTGHVRPSGYARSAMTEQSTLPSPPAAVPAAPPRTSARSWSPRAARRVLQRAGDLLDDARLLTTAEHPLRERVRDAYAATREVRVHADLRAVPVRSAEHTSE